MKTENRRTNYTLINNDMFLFIAVFRINHNKDNLVFHSLLQEDSSYQM